MKALIKLALITEPKEGMKVIYNNNIATLKCIRAQNFDPNLKFANKTHSWFITDLCGHVWEIFNSSNNKKILPQLRQIVGEYDVPRMHESDDWHKETLPVVTKDWDYILKNNLIGKEVEVEKIIDPESKRQEDDRDVLGLFHPKSREITYTEEEVLNMLWTSNNWNKKTAKQWLKNNYLHRRGKLIKEIKRNKL